jgi:hypothetical protein
LTILFEKYYNKILFKGRETMADERKDGGETFQTNIADFAEALSSLPPGDEKDIAIAAVNQALRLEKKEQLTAAVAVKSEDTRDFLLKVLPLRYPSTIAGAEQFRQEVGEILPEGHPLHVTPKQQEEPTEKKQKPSALAEILPPMLAELKKIALQCVQEVNLLSPTDPRLNKVSVDLLFGGKGSMEMGVSEGLNEAVLNEIFPALVKRSQQVVGFTSGWAVDRLLPNKQTNASFKKNVQAIQEGAHEVFTLMTGMQAMKMQHS